MMLKKFWSDLLYFPVEVKLDASYVKIAVIAFGVIWAVDIEKYNGIVFLVFIFQANGIPNVVNKVGCFIKGKKRFN